MRGRAVSLFAIALVGCITPGGEPKPGSRESQPARPAVPTGPGAASDAAPKRCAEPPPATKPMDLYWDKCDTNGLPLSPIFWQQKGQPIEKSPNPTALCQGFLEPHLCTSQPFTLNLPTGRSGLGAIIHGTCGTASRSLPGHVNYLLSATMTGTLFFLDYGVDDDFTLALVTDEPVTMTQGNLKKLNDGRPAIFVEAKRNETFARYSTKYWNDVRDAFRVDMDNKEVGHLPYVAETFDGRRAIVTGLLGLDCEHQGCAVELHPIYALAMRTSTGESNGDESWTFFARNVGTEGWCASSYPVQLETDRIEIQIPAPRGFFGVHLVDEDSAVRPSRADLTWNVVNGPNGTSALIVASLPLPAVQGEGGDYVEGVIRLRWDRAPDAGIAAPPAPALARAGRHTDGGTQRPRTVESDEGSLSTLLEGMSPKQRTIYRETSKALGSITVKRPEHRVGFAVTQNSTWLLQPKDLATSAVARNPGLTSSERPTMPQTRIGERPWQSTQMDKALRLRAICTAYQKSRRMPQFCVSVLATPLGDDN